MDFIVYAVYDEGNFIFNTTSEDAAKTAAARMRKGEIKQTRYSPNEWSPVFHVRRSHGTGKYYAKAVRQGTTFTEGKHVEYGHKSYYLRAPSAAEAERMADQMDGGRFFTIRLAVVEVDENGIVTDDVSERGGWRNGIVLDFRWPSLEVVQRKLAKLGRILQRSFSYPTPEGRPPYTRKDS